MKRLSRKASLTARQVVAQLTILSGSLLGLIALSQPAAEASYYYPFYGRGLTSMLYPLRYAMYPLMGFSGPYSSYTSYSPYRMLTTGRLIGNQNMYGQQQSMYSPNGMNGQQNINGQQMGQSYQSGDDPNNGQLADGEQLLSGSPPPAPPGYAQTPLLGSGALGYPGGNGYPATSAAGVSNAYLAHQGAGQFTLPQAGYNSAGHALPASDGTPPMAPPVASKTPVSLAPNLNAVAGGPAASAPLADGFINLVNTKFQGNVKTALFDPETRGWAKMLGVVNGDSMFGMDFSDTRVELIRQIFADQGLDSVSKLGAVKILLHSTGSTGANRAKH